MKWRLLSTIAVAGALLILPGAAYAACTAPAGVEGEVEYNIDFKVVQFCDGTNWTRLGSSYDTRIGTLTANRWCAANAGGTAFDCTQNAPVMTAGSDTQVIFNDAGTIAGAANMLWLKTLNSNAGGLRLGSSSAPTVTLDVTGDAKISGKMAVGFTGTPAAALQVNGDILGTANAGSYRTWGLANGTDTSLVLQGGAASGSGGNIELLHTGSINEDATTHYFRSLDGATSFVNIDNVGALNVGATAASVIGSLLNVASTGYAQFQKTFAGAPTAGDCGATQIGRVTYDTTNNRFYFCNGTAWVYTAMGTSGGATAAGSANDVQFRNTSTGAFDADGTFIYDKTNHRLGIGSTVPQVKLGVTGASGAYNGNSNNGIFQITTGTGADTSEAMLMGVVDGSYSWIQAAKPGTLPRNLALNPSGGNVGMGLIPKTSTSLLTTNGDVSITTSSAQTVHFNSYYNSGWKAYNSGYSGAVRLDSTTGQLQFINSTTSVAADAASTIGFAMVINSNGNVGIGTTSPNAGNKLEVFGNIGYSDGSALYPRTASVADWYLGKHIGTDNIENELGSNNAATQFRIGTLVSSAFSANAAIAAGSGANSYFAANGGNVGIGTVAPAVNLDLRSANTSTVSQIMAADSTAARFVQLWSGSSASSLSPAILYSSASALRFGPSAVDGTTFAEKMRIDSNGNVGIGTASPLSNLDVAGSIRGFNFYPGGAQFPNLGGSATLVCVVYQRDITGSYSMGYCTGSDRRLKTNIEDMAVKNGLAAIEQLRPVSFNWKDAQLNKTDGPQIGFVAQDVQKIFPGFVSKNGPAVIKSADGKEETISDTLTVNYAKMVVPLVKAVQELKADNDDLRTENAAEIKELRAEIEALKASIH